MGRSRQRNRPAAKAPLTRRLAAGVLTGALLCLCPAIVWACKYSVRDVGFVDLDAQPYRLVCLVDGPDDAEFRRAFAVAADRRLAESNIETEVIDVAADPDHPLFKDSSVTAAGATPRLVLLAPETDFPPLELSARTAEAIDAELAGLAMSTMRDAILNSIVDAYAVVVVVEGNDAGENRRVAEAVDFAIGELNGVMAKLDKPVKTPPQRMTISADRAAAERVLLWSWGLDPEQRDETSVVMLFGRGRRLGPVVTGSDIVGPQLFETLSLVGRSCECELDRSWMQGPMFPLVWDTTRQADVTRSLGFDAENPLVKVEMSRIIARGAQNRATQQPVAVTEIDPLLGYGEIDVDIAGTDTNQVEETTAAVETVTEVVAPVKASPSEAETAEATAISTETPPTGETEPAVSPSLGVMAAVTVGALCLIALAGGLFLLFRRRGQA